jgi:Bacterial Ig domain/Secretion system C-terminal sorting domain
MRTAPYITLVLMLSAFQSESVQAQVPNLGSEFVVFVDSTNSLIPEVEGSVVADPTAPDNPVLRLDYSEWASVGIAFLERDGADMSAMVSADPADTKTLYLRLLIDPLLQGRGVCQGTGAQCVSVTMFDSFSGPQDSTSIANGAGDAPMRLKWFIPDSLRDGNWHSLAIPLPPSTLADLESARSAGTLSPAQAGWHYTGAWTGGYGIGCCGSELPTSQDPLWREFDWTRVARLGVQYDFSPDGDGGYIDVDDVYIGDSYTDLSAWGEAAVVTPIVVSPADGADDTPSTLSLHWMGRRGATHTIQVSRDPSFNTVDLEEEVIGDSLLVESLTAATTYHWRVRGSGRGTSEWSNPRSFAVGAVSAPTLASPSNGAVAVPIPGSFEWTSISGAISYRMQVATDTSFTFVLHDEAGIPGTSIAGLALEFGQSYAWRVRAESVEGAGEWPVAAVFQTVEQAPLPPTTPWPLDGTLDVTTTPVLSWSAGDGARTYDVEVSLTDDFLAPLVRVEILSTTYSANALGRGVTYFWRVRSVNTGGKSEWLSQSFSTEMDPPVATRLVQPPDGAVDTGLRVSLWWDAVMTAELYRIEVSHSVSFDKTVVDTVQVGLDSLVVGPLRPYRVHFWRVRAVNRGGESAWSNIYSFRTALNEPPVAVNDSAVSLEDVPVDVAVLLNDSDPDSDPLSIASFTEPSNGFVYESSPGTLRYVPFQDWAGVDSLRYTTDDGRGGTSDAWLRVNVTPVNDPPTRPEILLPLPGAVLNVQGDPGRLFRVLWNPATDVEGDALTYRWEFSTSSRFIVSTISEEVGAETSVAVGYGRLAAALSGAGLAPLDSGTAYHRIVASDGTDQTAGPTITLPVVRGLITDVDSPEDLPTELELESVYPNPARDQITLRIANPTPATASVRVVDALGRVRETRTLQLEAGRHQVRFDTLRLPSGFYMVLVEVHGTRMSVPVLIAR